ncbi:hypothetical protein PCE1_000311 [Barthelona sp. PCE]
MATHTRTRHSEGHTSPPALTATENATSAPQPPELGGADHTGGMPPPEHVKVDVSPKRKNKRKKRRHGKSVTPSTPPKATQQTDATPPNDNKLPEIREMMKKFGDSQEEILSRLGHFIHEYFLRFKVETNTEFNDFT